MNFNYFNVDLLSSDSAEIEKAFAIAFCDETSDQKTATTDAATPISSSSDGKKQNAKPKATAKKARKKQKRIVIEADLRDLAKDALNQMKENEMLNALYSDHILRLLKNVNKPLTTFPFHDLKERLEKTCRKFSSRFITTAREAMWEEFNTIWTDENISKSIIHALGVTSDFCSWFLLYLQQTVAKRYLQCESTSTLVNTVDLSDAEKESVAYIAGAVLKNVGDKLCELKRNLISNDQDVTIVDKEIAILDACKESKEEISDGLTSSSTSTKLIEALNRGGLIYPKTSVINMFLVVEGIFRQKIRASSKKICNDILLSESLGNESVQGNFLGATEHETAEHEHKFRILERCVNFYIKVRSYAHARYVTENYRVDTKTERKKKALRKKLKLSEEDH